MVMMSIECRVILSCIGILSVKKPIAVSAKSIEYATVYSFRKRAVIFVVLKLKSYNQKG